MISPSKEGISIALCFVALFMTATVNAQLSSIPHRQRRNKIEYNKQERLGRKQRHQRQQQQQHANNIGRQLDGDFSTPLHESVFDMADPSSAETSIRMMSIPLQELGFDMSIPLQELDFDLSMPLHTKRKRPESYIALESRNNGSSIISASSLVGISALVVGAMALFVKVRKFHNSQLEGCVDETSCSDSDSNSVVRVIYFGDDDIENSSNDEENLDMPHSR